MHRDTHRLTFTDAERSQLRALEITLSRRLCVPVHVETCDDDGDEYACIRLADMPAWDGEVLATIQLIKRPARGYVVLRPDGHPYGSKDTQNSLAGDFVLTHFYAKQVAVTAAIEVRASSLALKARMPLQQELEQLRFRLNRERVAYRYRCH